MVLLQSLITLKLAGNNIRNPGNLFHMAGLIMLDLSGNRITKLTNDMITERLELDYLDLSSNDMESIDE